MAGESLHSLLARAPGDWLCAQNPPWSQLELRAICWYLPDFSSLNTLGMIPGPMTSCEFQDRSTGSRNLPVTWHSFHLLNPEGLAWENTENAASHFLHSTCLFPFQAKAHCI